MSENLALASGGTDRDFDIEKLTDDIGAITDEWIGGHASQFDPRGWESKDAHELRRKACSEAALFLLQARKVPGASVNVPELDEIVLDVANDPLFYELLHREPMSVRSYGYTLLYAHEENELSDEDVWEDLGRCLESESLRAIDRLPFENLDLWHMNKIYGRDVVIGPSEIFPLSGLPHSMNIFQVDLEDVYPFTHHLMFHRGMGMEEYGFPDEPIPYDLETELCGLILRFLGTENYDVTLELLLGGILHHQVPPDLAVSVLDIVREAATEEGKVPDNTVDDDSVDTIAGEVEEALGDLGDEAVEWGQHYHVNLIAGYTVRAIRAEWNDFVAAYSDAERPHYDRENLIEFGEMVAAFARYDLQEGARKLMALADQPVVDAFPRVFDEAVAFLEAQRRSDGTFGYWAKERMKFESLGHDPDQFTAQLVDPVSDLCNEALSAANEGR